MENERNELPQTDEWLEDVLGTLNSDPELSPVEEPVAAPEGQPSEPSQTDDWLDEILGTAATQSELGPDEDAVAAAGLIHPDDLELEMILAEHRQEEQMSIPLPDEPVSEGETTVIPQVPGETEAPAQTQELGETQYFDTSDMVYSDEPQEEEEEEPEGEEEEEPVRKGRPRRKKGYGLLGIPHILATFVWLAIILAIGLSMGRILWLCCADLMAFGKEPVEAVITISSGDTMETIANKLGDKGLIRYPMLFKTFAEITGKDERISTGTFTLHSKLDYNAMINNMTYYGAARQEVDIMFPEGYNCSQIFALLEKNNVCSVAELEAYAANGELPEYWFLEGVERGDRYCLEGYLFPDTYTFYTNDDPGRVLEKFLDAFDARFTDLMRERLVEINERFAQMLANEGYSQEYIDANPITIREVVIIASLIEKESANADENYTIASVIYNRLSDSSQPPYLNIDAAVLYGLNGNIDPITGESKPLTQADLEFDTPYNTYLHTGLTPTAIANPGQEALNAALVPEDTTYLYYALNPETGTHKFFTNYNDFLRFLETVEY